MMRTTMLRTRGFSLVELMIAVAIGVLALALAMQLIGGSQSAKSAALGTSDSMQNGMLAMFSISGDAQQAGFGLSDRLLLGCDTIFKDEQGYELSPVTPDSAVHPLSPVIIHQGKDGAPDTISLYAGSSSGVLGVVRVMKNYLGAENVLTLDRAAFGFTPGDVIVVAPEDRDGQCALAQVSGTTVASSPLLYLSQDTKYRYNTGSLGKNFDADRARVFNLGPATSLAFHTWSVSDGFLQLRATDMEGAGEKPVVVADDIVSIKALYGVDTRSADAFEKRTSLQVGAWSAEMVDADGDGAIGAEDYRHLAAVRIAVVARSKKREPGVDGKGVCTTTATAPTVFEKDEPAGVDTVATKIDLSANASWQCYRYRVFETVVPLRNLYSRTR